MEHIDEYGKWEVTEGKGCINRRNIEPTQKYIDEHLQEFQPKTKQEITKLKAELSATDYKIVKCFEYQLAGQPMPYDIAALHAMRQSVRDRINTLETNSVETQ